jgi:PAS domain S-box-containing protein
VTCVIVKIYPLKLLYVLYTILTVSDSSEARDAATRPPVLMTAACALTMAAGALTLLGYVIGLKILVRPVADGPLMAADTALAFIVLGAGLWLVARAPSPTWRRVGQVLGLAVALFAVTVLAEYVANRSFGIDLLLFPGRLHAWSTVGALGRPSPSAAVTFLLAGLAVALLDTDAGHQFAPAQVLVSAVALIAWTQLVGYVFGVSYLRHGTDVVSGIALITTIAFVVLAVGLLACRPDRPPANAFAGHTPGAATLRQMVPVVTGVLVLAAAVTGVGRADHRLGRALAVMVAIMVVVLAVYLLFVRAAAALDRIARDLNRERDFNQTALRSLREGVMVTDSAGQVLQVNPRWCEITGFPARDVTGLRPPFPWWPPEEVPERTAHLSRLLNVGASIEAEASVRRPDGTDVPVMFTADAVGSGPKPSLVVFTYHDLTERNRAEAARRRAAAQLDHFFDISNDLLCIAGIDGYFKRLNPAWERILGYTVDELCARPYLDFIHPDDQERTGREAEDQAAIGKVTVSFDNRYRCRDGSYRWLNWNATPTADGTVYAVARDTTDQREADRARGLLAAIVDGTHDSTIGMTLDGTIVSWNPAAERAYGYTAEEAIGQSIDLVTMPERGAEMYDILDRVASGEQVSRHQTVRRRKDGTLRHVEVTVSPIRDSSGAVVGAASIARDITDKIKAEDRFRRLIQAAPDAMLIVDQNGCIVLANEQTERLFGYTAAELIAQPVGLLVAQQPDQPPFGNSDGYFAQPQERRMGSGLELSGQRRDGTEFPIEISLASVDTGEDGMMTAAAIRDVSERREAEQALGRARDEALAADRLKSQFVAMVSHEIRTPMNGVIGLTGLLLETPLQPTQLRYARAIRSSGRALLTIINDILDFSKIEAGKIELVDSDFDLDLLLETVIQVAAEAGRGKDLEIIGYCPPGLPTAVRGDDGRLRQALLNLLGNAVKFTEHGEVLLRATRATDAADGRPRVTFAVSDTGIGIAAKDLPLLFQPFSQLDAAPDRQFGGTGLGLSIARQLIELMGGRLEVRSELGQGSEFSFTIPLTPRSGSVPQRDTAHCLADQRMLIVDDNPTSRQLLSEHASAWGMSPADVPDGGTALAHLREAAEHHQPYAVAIIDQHMPGLGGLDLTRMINADSTLAATRLVLLTSGTYREDENAEAAGAAAVLSKPICPSEMYNCLVDLLDPSATESAHLAVPAARTADGDGRLILLAEDNEVNQMVASDMLSMLGYRVDIARNGLEAVQCAISKPYAAILMDCQMPRMDGYAATAELRRQEVEGHRIPIIAMTAGALAEDRDRCLAAGMDDYLTKPIDIDRLRETVERWAAGASASPLPEPRQPLPEARM